MRNPFRQGVFPHVVQMLAPYLSTTAGGETAVDPEGTVLRLIIDEAERRLFGGQMVEAYDWDDIVARVAVRVASSARASEALPEVPRFDIAALVRHYCTVPGMIARLEGAYEVLDELSSAGYTLAVVTNGYLRYQAPVLEALGLADFFSAIITPEQAHAAKPMPGIFHMAWAGWNSPVHIGDHIIHDVWGAKAAGGYSIWLHRNVPDSLRSLIAEDRPRAEDFASIRDASFRATMAADAYGTSPGDCQPDALMHSLGELPELLDRLRYRDT